VVPVDVYRIAKDAGMPDEGAGCSGDGSELVQHCPLASEAEEHLVEPGSPDFDVHSATGEECKCVRCGSDNLVAVNVFGPSYTGRGEEVKVDFDPDFRWQLHKEASFRVQRVFLILLDRVLARTRKAFWKVRRSDEASFARRTRDDSWGFPDDSGQE
jgi:hypothetical protein